MLITFNLALVSQSPLCMCMILPRGYYNQTRKERKVIGEQEVKLVKPAVRAV